MNVPPTGTITFLFSDIEGSSKKWDQQPDAMRVALGAHDRMLRETFEACGGFVFKTVGDAFCVAFDTATDALAGALESQRALRAADWSAIGEMKVRMALHTGAAEQRDGDYFGQSLNRVARILAAAHGGQVLLSLPRLNTSAASFEAIALALPGRYPASAASQLAGSDPNNPKRTALKFLDI